MTDTPPILDPLPPSPMPPPTLSKTNPGGCFVLLNSILNYEAAQKVVTTAYAAVKQGFPSLTLCINSSGGIIDHAYYAFNALRALPIAITTHNMGGIRSAANILYMAGDIRTAAPSSVFFFHESSLDAPGPMSTGAGVHRLLSLQEDDNRTAETVATHSGQAPDVVLGWQRSHQTISAIDAVKLGIAQRVEALVIPANALIENIMVG